MINGTSLWGLSSTTILRFTLYIVSGQVFEANCPCKAGREGFFNHVLATVEKPMIYAKMMMNSQMLHARQKWHKKGRGDKITAEPIMEIAVSKTKLDEIESWEGVKCLLYDARCNPKNDVEAEMKFKNALKELNPGMGLSIMAGDYSSINSF